MADINRLPTELHITISRHLPYPDALSLKHTCRHFYDLVDTGVRLKVSWLIDRRRRHLECPSNGRCTLKSDEAFCSREVRRLIERRRRHEECVGAKACMVLDWGICEGARRRRGIAYVLARQWLSWGGKHDLRQMWLAVLVAAVVLCWLRWCLTAF